MKVIYTDAHLGHNPQQEIAESGSHSPHEHTARAENIRETLQADATMKLLPPTQWGVDPINAVHNPGLNNFLTTAWNDYQREVRPSREVVPDFFYRPSLRDEMSQLAEPTAANARLGWWCFETTTPITDGSYIAARGAVDTALTATQLVLGGEKFAYGLCRPPGHHATTDLYGGYCFFNNAAIAAHHVATTTGTRVTVLDVDYHHGNGTQQIFYGRGDVQYVSLHGDPQRAYPYITGFADELGEGKGRGSNTNIPLAAKTDDDRFLDALDEACEAVQSFGPSLLIVSLGLDTFVTDPICDLAVTRDGFSRSGARVRGLGLPTVVLQEGGYDLANLGLNVQAWLHGLENS
jgi:acetoin utilization deacetylase AcuC-like enzyme